MDKDEKKVEPPSGSTTPTNEKPKMEVSVETLQNLLDTVEGLKKAREENNKKIIALESIASQTRLQEAKAVMDEDKRPRVHFKKIQQGVVVGWPSKKEEPDKVKNEILINPTNNNPMGEIIKIKYKLVDGTETDFLDYVEFVRCTDLVFARVLEDRGNSALLEFEDKSIKAEPIEVKKVFFNA
jgi:hypothetical protein